LSATLQLEPSVQLHGAPKLLVEWSSPWQDFVTSIRPAFGPAGERLAGEAPHGVFPYRGLLAAWVMEVFLLFVVIVLPRQIARMLPYAPAKVRPYEVIYYTGDELPRTEDVGGAQSGSTGRAGGQEAHHRTQTIRVARGSSPSEKVVDAPNLKLPVTMDAVANLLAVKPVPGPPPSEGLHAALILPNFPPDVIAPAPTKVSHDHLRRGESLDAIIPPAPNVTRDKPLNTPTLKEAVIPPAPSASRDRVRAAPELNSSVIAPAPEAVSRNRMRSTPALNGSVIPPAPDTVGPEVARSPVQSMASVIPPPVSAPERDIGHNPKLALPSPNVIAPPPDTNASLRRAASGSAAGNPNVVPPPPAANTNTSIVSTFLGKIFGTQDIVPPPPSTPSGSPSGTTRGSNGSGLATNVIPPPPSAGGSGTRAGAPGTPNGPNGGTLLASNVIPPPPGISSGAQQGAFGTGRKGNGFGGVGEIGSVQAPANGGGSAAGTGVMVSSDPGSKVGNPGGVKGALAMSPGGGDNPGLGGAGGGSGIGHGNGPGSGMTGTGSGAGKSGTGRGSDPNARGGISPSAGPGGAGNAPGGTPVVPGVSISGGSTQTIVNLPSFGSDAGSSDPKLPGRSSVKGGQGPDITIVATSRSGGAFNFYGELKGDKVYTIYLPTTLGQAVMQFADPTSAVHAYADDLLGPEKMRVDLPPNLKVSRLVIACTLDASGRLTNLHVLEPGSALFTAKVMAALPSWKFRPAMRGNQPVPVTAILGFGINTDDRY
jgi:hypothetical protein